MTNLELAIDMAFRNQLHTFIKLCKTVIDSTDPKGRCVNPFLTELLSSIS